MADVAVTNVTVTYAFRGESFTVTFPNPNAIDAIVFSRVDLDRIKAGQLDATKEAVREVRLEPSVELKAAPDNVSGALSSSAGRDSTAPMENRGLWWHSSACTWFHPEALG
ncbi:MAG TPA: hypothetical protein VJ717_10930 [Gemmatimonadaceae bacterium]|nr:hypothetical protein [Gemmatimonadaceae bacterium]